MRKRTYARELALQMLYQVDITHEPPEAVLNNFWQSQENPIQEQVRDFSAEIVKGVTQNLAMIDAKISEYATNWQLKRMAVVDRNILRLSCYELIFRQDIPPKVSINEAVDLAKKYSGQEAGKFVNGVLDRIKTEGNK
ncbi:MAG: transcription antitermination factor NusB [Candidatus Omnitrophica bacterium]|nr:transcription antitermination factor NusB [Candidatus Omnitrophota bacterium]